MASTTVWFACGNVRGDLRDLLAFDEDVGVLLAGCVDDGAVLDQGSHAASLTSDGDLMLAVGSDFTMRLRNETGGGTLFPCLWREAVVDALHGDAVFDRADERAEIAADALVLRRRAGCARAA